MRKRIICLLLLMYSAVSYAQHSIKGTVRDTLENRGLHYASIVLSGKDSSLIASTRSAKNGSFNLSNIPPATYNLLVSYPGFADLSDEIVVGDKDVDAGTIALTLKSKLLDAVIISTAAAIRVKGDTTEFVADSFKVRDGATVEELLKKLPGFQVDSKGGIKTQGKTVDKVLVDGEEFFGDDPTMATKNLSAKIVDKVQVYDTKTEQQALTGTTTGNEGKTVNIKLKENSKKGSFGKLNAGTDFRELVDAKALFNKFIGKKKISVYGNRTNLDAGSLNWQDRNKLGIEEDYEYDELMGYYYSFGESDDFSNWSVRGLPDAYTAGALYSNKWKNDTQSVNLSYRYNRLKTFNEGSTRAQNILPEAILYNNTNTVSNGLNQQHAGNGKWIWKIDSLSTLTYTTSASYKDTKSYNNVYSETLNGADTLNKNRRINENDILHRQWSNGLNYKKLFKKKDRQLLINGNFTSMSDDNNGLLTSSTGFYKRGLVDSVANLDQQKLFDGASNTYGIKVSYNEPLSKTWSVLGQFSYNLNNSSSYSNTYDKAPSGKYETKNAVFSNNFDLTALSNTGKLLFKYTGKKIKGSFGSGLSAVELKLHNLDNDHRNTFNFLNITPSAQVNYSIKPQTNLRLSYNGNTVQPGISQLQPLRNNTDPLNEYIGNPDLRVGFRHSLNMNYNSSKVLSQRYMYAGAYYSFTQNAITNFNSVDVVTGKRIYRPVNVNGNQNWSLWSGWNKDGGNKKLGHYVGINGNGGRYVNFVNGREGRTNNLNVELEYGASYRVDEKYDLSLRPKAGYAHSVSSFNKTAAVNYFTFGGELYTNFTLPWKMELNSNLEADLRQKTAAFGRANNIVNWRAELSKKVFKDGSGKIILVANDILNQNKGYERIIQSNFISDDRYLRRSRYFLLKFEWSFTKMPGGEAGAGK